MATAFFFRAIASDGKVRTGTLTAETERLVAAELRRQGLTPVYVGAEQKKGFELKLPTFDRGKRQDVLFFTQELSTLLNAGIPLDRALWITAELTERGNFRSLVIDVVRILKGGKSLADSLAAHPAHFSELYINMVRAGEASGSLAQIFERLSEFERTRDDLRGYIISSMIYPVLLTLVGIASIFMLLNFVVPRFALIFSDPQMKIPTPTLLMMQASRLVQDWWLPVAVGLTVAISHFRLTSGPPPAACGGIRSGCAFPYWATRCARPKQLALRAPWGLWFRPACLWSQSIDISRGILNNHRMAASSRSRVSRRQARRRHLHALRRTGAFPPLAGHLLSVGEETGRLDAMFNRMADIYENETRTAIRRFTSLFEPLIILMMGLIVGSLILSLLLAITSINDVAV